MSGSNVIPGGVEFRPAGRNQFVHSIKKKIEIQFAVQDLLHFVRGNDRFIFVKFE
jgi:hypothetical protein